MLCLPKVQLHGIIFKGLTGFASTCPVTDDFLAGPKTSPCTHGLWQRLCSGGLGVGVLEKLQQWK